MASPTPMPLRGTPPNEIALPNAPLVTVIAQVRFPTILAVSSQEQIIGFHERIRTTYPHLERQEIQATFPFVPPPPLPSSTAGMFVHWRFADGIAADWKWRISLTQDFISLETKAYESRSNFLGRLEFILQAFLETLKPTHVTRFGIRYIDQITGDGVSRIDSLLRGEVMGVASSLGGEAIQHFTELYVPADPGHLLARWGKLPANMTIDPNLIPPLPENTWVIDLDVSKNETAYFETAAVIETARLAAERVYAIFRWMVTDEFLKAYGGKA